MMSMASCPFVRNRRFSGRPVTSDFTGSVMSSAGIHWRAPARACPGLSPPHVRQVHRVDAVRDPARAAHVLPFHARGRRNPASPGPSHRAPRPSSAVGATGATGVQSGCRIAPDLAHRRRFVPRGTVQQPLRPSRRLVAGLLAYRPPVPRGRSLTSAFRYFPACSHVCVRAKHDRSSPIRADLSQSARRAPILASPAALYSFVSTNNMIPGRLPSSHGNLRPTESQQLTTRLDAAVLVRNSSELYDPPQWVYQASQRERKNEASFRKADYPGMRRWPFPLSHREWLQLLRWQLPQCSGIPRRITRIARRVAGLTWGGGIAVIKLRLGGVPVPRPRIAHDRAAGTRGDPTSRPGHYSGSGRQHHRDRKSVV